MPEDINTSQIHFFFLGTFMTFGGEGGEREIGHDGGLGQCGVSARTISPLRDAQSNDVL